MQAFYAVVEEGNISHAALRLDIAQPALSRQMKRLETSLGVQLFERGSRRIRLTETGRLLYARVESILSLVEGTVRDIAEIGSGQAGTVRVGTVTSSGALILPELMHEFHRRYPQMTFQVFEAEGTRVLEMLDSRTIEIGITRSQVDASFYDSIILENEPLVVVMTKEDSQRNNTPDTVRLAELRDKPIIVPLRWKAPFVTHCQRAGFTPHLVCVSDSIVLDVLNVQQGLGIALVPASARSLMSDDGRLVTRRLIEPEIMTHTVVSWLRNHPLPASAQHFIGLFRELHNRLTI